MNTTISESRANTRTKALNNIDPERDARFTMGPVDVLDHASRTFTYGSKLGLDGTRKFPEEGFTRNWPEVIEMDDDPAKSIRTKRDSTLVRAAEAVRDGKAIAAFALSELDAGSDVAALAGGNLKYNVPQPDMTMTPGVALGAGTSAAAPMWAALVSQFNAIFHDQEPRRPMLSAVSLCCPSRIAVTGRLAGTSSFGE